MNLLQHPNNNCLTLREQIERCASWQELLALFFSGAELQQGGRITNLPVVSYEDPTICRLYDVLHQEERALYLAGVIQQFKSLIMQLPRHSTIVEVGCGPGHLLLGLATDPEIASLKMTFTGFDPSTEMIAIANEKLLASGQPPSVSFFVAGSSDSSAIEALRQSSFLICRNVLSWVSDPEAEIERWANVLPAHAKICIRELRRDIPFEIARKRLLECLPFRYRGAQLAFPVSSMLSAYLRALTPQEVGHSLACAGFTYTELPVQAGVPADGRKTSDAEMFFLATRAP